jgi:hypothetical protein
MFWLVRVEGVICDLRFELLVRLTGLVGCGVKQPSIGKKSRKRDEWSAAIKVHLVKIRNAAASAKSRRAPAWKSARFPIG